MAPELFVRTSAKQLKPFALALHAGMLLPLNVASTAAASALLSVALAGASVGSLHTYR